MGLSVPSSVAYSEVTRDSSQGCVSWVSASLQLSPT